MSSSQKTLLKPKIPGSINTANTASAIAPDMDPLLGPPPSGIPTDFQHPNQMLHDLHIGRGGMSGGLNGMSGMGKSVTGGHSGVGAGVEHDSDDDSEEEDSEEDSDEDSDEDDSDDEAPTWAEWFLSTTEGKVGFLSTTEGNGF